FFANISHEFRTPLTLILGPIQKWKRSLNPEERSDEGSSAGMKDEILRLRSATAQDVEMMERNAQRLLRLINQLLDLSKLEAGGMKLQTSKQNIVPFVKGIAQSFESSAGRRSIALNIEAESENIEVYFDRDKLEKILVNLLSNAFKFTAEGGRITVTLTPVPSPNGRGVSAGRGEGFVEVKIADSGIGIPRDQLDKVFDRFYQVDASQTREQEGSGIGLALTKELVELHHGTIEVRSEVGKGTEFVVRLPLGKEHLKDDEVVETPDPTVLSLRATKGSEAISYPNEIASALENVPRNDNLPLILIIEDNADVRAYIRSYLEPQYRMLDAVDGVDGVEQAKENIPDLIICDVMMPKMDGYEVCKRLKQDEKTSHVPI
ncbi:MAG: hybrid sensor histidine kinase/response regulator, partial [Bacteroidota bacterium]